MDSGIRNSCGNERCEPKRYNRTKNNAYGAKWLVLVGVLPKRYNDRE